MNKDEVEKEIDEDLSEEDSELEEAEEESTEDLEVSGENFDSGNFSIGDIGLATSSSTPFWKGNLESSLVDEPQGRPERVEEGLEENQIYQGAVDERAGNVYNGLEKEGDFYTEGGKGADLYSADSGNYNARAGSGEFYDPRVGKRADIGEVRSADKSGLEITGLGEGFSRGTAKDLRGKRSDKNYTN